jgi:hypothetical protein
VVSVVITNGVSEVIAWILRAIRRRIPRQSKQVIINGAFPIEQLFAGLLY